MAAMTVTTATAKPSPTNRNGEAEPNLPLRTLAMAKPSTPANRDGEAEPECGHATLVAVMTQAEQPNATTHDCDWGLTLGARCYLFRIGRARSVRPFPPDTAPRKGPEVKPQSLSSRSGDEMTRLVRTFATTNAR